MATIATKPITVDEFEQMMFEHPVDLVKGEILEMPPAGSQHGRMALNVGFLLESWCRAGNHGLVMGNDAAIVVAFNPDTVRGADISFLGRARVPKDGLPEGALRIPPDLVVEVQSPFDRPNDVTDKVSEYLAAGVREVWVVNGTHRHVDVYRPDGGPKRFTNADTISSADVLPGFSCPVAEIFRNV